MQTQPSSEPKPVTDWHRPDLSELPRLTFARRLFRLFARGLAKLLALIYLRVTTRGLENFPRKGPALIVINHLGDADVVLLSAYLPYSIDGIGKVENDEHWLVGPMFRAYGVIGIHRGKPDRKAIRAALDGLAEERMIAIAPEGRQSLDGKLEEGANGAAFLALKSGAPVVPVAMTGTENEYVYNRNWWKRAPATLSVGKPFFIQTHPERFAIEGKQADRQKAMQDGTRQIMESLASLLPESYVGNYKAG